MVDPFRVRIAVRAYELDAQGHVSGAVYHQYGDHARWETLRAAGISVPDILASGIAPVNLEVVIRYHGELRGGDEVDITTEFVWGDGKSFKVVQEFLRPDGSPVAELKNTGGLLHLENRRLIPDPGSRFRSLARTPEVLNLAP